jgi:hypothetical protein
MKVRVILASFLVAAVASPAFAASYYVVQNSKTHKCSVTTKKPSDKSKTLTLAGDGTAYASKAEATAALATIEACKKTT